MWASRRLGRPVKWMATRTESMLRDTTAATRSCYGELALDDNGKILGMRGALPVRVGAYVVGAGARGRRCSRCASCPSVYDIQTMLITSQGRVHQHRADRALSRRRPPGGDLSHRAAARPRGAQDRHRPGRDPPAQLHPAEQAAVHDADVLDLRQRRFRARHGRVPASSPTGRASQTRSASRRRAASCAAARVDLLHRAGRRSSTTAWSCASTRAASVTIVAGTHSHGQGHATVYAQMVSRVARRAVRDHPLRAGRHRRRCRIGRGTYAARSSMVGGNALKVAADAIVEKAKPMAAALMEAADRRHRVQGRALPHRRHRQGDGADRRRQGVLRADGPADRQVRRRPGGERHVRDRAAELSRTAATSARSRSIPRPARSTLDRYAVVDDVGSVINPLICEGQIHGGVAQGVGQALMENVVYDRQSGQLLSGELHGLRHAARRRLARIRCRRSRKSRPRPIRSASRASGEAGAIGAPPAVINAILDALRPLGVEHIDMPATADTGVGGDAQARTGGVNLHRTLARLARAEARSPAWSEAECAAAPPGCRASRSIRATVSTLLQLPHLPRLERAESLGRKAGLAARQRSPRAARRSPRR